MLIISPLYWPILEKTKTSLAKSTYKERNDANLAGESAPYRGYVNEISEIEPGNDRSDGPNGMAQSCQAQMWAANGDWAMFFS